DPSRNPITRLARRTLRNKTLQRLEQMQAADDSFLASPLMTAFVVMSLADAGYLKHPIVSRGVEFLFSMMRSDSSWPLAAGVSTYNTVLAVESFIRKPAKGIASAWDSASHAGLSHVDWQDAATSSDTLLEPGPESAAKDHDSSMLTLSEIREHALEWIL